MAGHSTSINIIYLFCSSEDKALSLPPIKSLNLELGIINVRLKAPIASVIFLYVIGLALSERALVNRFWYHKK